LLDAKFLIFPHKKSSIATPPTKDAMEVILKRLSDGFNNKEDKIPTSATHTLLKTELATLPTANLPSPSLASTLFPKTKTPSTLPFNPPLSPSVVMLSHGKTTIAEL
jgi:hypothetical protein